MVICDSSASTSGDCVPALRAAGPAAADGSRVAPGRGGVPQPSVVSDAPAAAAPMPRKRRRVGKIEGGTFTAVALNTNERRLTRSRIGVCNARENKANPGELQ